MGESRQELIAWLNDVLIPAMAPVHSPILTPQLLQLNLTKVEQCGQGAALAQVFDSIYRTLALDAYVIS